MKKVRKWFRMSGKKKLLLLTVIIAGIVSVFLGVHTMKDVRGREAAAGELPVQETQAKIGKISNTIVGTGNLECGEEVSVAIPSGVVVDEVKVESGDSVSKGDVLAVVNEASVRRAMEDIQEEIDALDEEIDDSKDDTDSQSVKSKVDGKVKKIYVQEGQEVSECMAAQGALMVLSMEDYVTAEDEADTEILVTATVGSVAEICVSEGDDVYAGTTLFKLESDGQTLEYQEEMAKRQELAKTLQKLTVLSQNTTITAESDGIIKSVNISAEGSTGETQDAQVSKNATAVVGSASHTAEDGAETESTTENGKGDEEQNVNGNLLTLKVEESGVTDKDTLVVETPETGKKPQTALQAKDGSYEGTIAWTPSGKKFAAETSYQAYVSLSAADGYLFGTDSISQVKAGVLSGIEVAEEGKKLSFCITYPFTLSESPDGESGKGNGGNYDGSEGNENNDGNKNSGGNENNGTVTGQGSNGNGNGSAAGNSSVSSQSGVVLASASSSSAAASQESTETADSDSEITAFVIASSDTMTLSVNVDELDINSVSKDQQAEITLDAVEGETFTGKVVKVGNTASSSGGVAKYTVKLTVPGDERMKEGMNASAVITIEERENVVTIPVNALQERGNQAFVYTQVDSEGNLQGEQEVTTGLSDGETVEITDGLSEGDSVYYQRSGNISRQDSFPGAGGMEGGPGGAMEDMKNGNFKGGEAGGGMPDGNMPGKAMPGGQQ